MPIADLLSTSEVPPIQTESLHCRERAKGARKRLMHRGKQMTAFLFDQLVGAREQHRRHFKAERFRSLEIDS